MKKLSFVIPCYKSEKTISDVIGRIVRVVQEDGRYDYEIICVNDGSTDGTYAVLREIAEKNHKIIAMDLSRNYGQHAALMAGFNSVSGDYVVCIDDDGENPPEKVFELVDKLVDGDYDWVSAKYTSDDRGIIRRLGSQLNFMVSRILIEQPKDFEMNSYMVFRRYVCDEIIKYTNPYPFVGGLLLRVTRRVANVEIEREERISGTSGYNIKKLVSLWLNSLTAFSEKPLRIISVLGIIASLAGIIYAIVIIIRKIVNPSIMIGYTSTMAAIMLMGGIILMALGFVGEYISRLYISANKAPQFVIRERYNGGEKKEI